LPLSAYFTIFVFMETGITINEDLYRNIMKYTHASDISEAVNIALKDWMVFQRIREFNNKLCANTISINNRYIQRDTKKVYS